MKKKIFISSKDKKDWLAFTKQMGSIKAKESDLLREDIETNKVPKLDDEINSLMKLRLSMVKKEKELLICDMCYINKNVITYNKDRYGETSLCDGCVSGKEGKNPYKECKYKKPY